MGQLFSSDKNDGTRQRTETRPPPPTRFYAPSYSSYTGVNTQSDYINGSSMLTPFESRGVEQRSRIETSSSNVPPRPDISAILPSPSDSYGNTTLTTSYDTIRKKYGYYECSCGAWWESGHSWAHATQDCKQCGEHVYPYRQEELRPRGEDSIGEPKAPHREDLCGMCKKLERSCTLMMSGSGNARYPNDVVVKGLLMDINEARLRVQFRTYGTIVKVTIPEARKNSHSRMAFITFADREAALQKFNNGGNTNQQNRRMKMY